MASNGGWRTIALNDPAHRTEPEPGIDVSLRYITVVAWGGLLAMAGAFCYALAAGQFPIDVSRPLENPWGFATVVDVYVGFAIFSCWVVWREARVTRAIAWVVLIMLGGNLVSALYLLVALRSSRGSFNHFWHGSDRVEHFT
jgi:hypothetical protein